jgi:hypothetical protein
MLPIRSLTLSLGTLTPISDVSACRCRPVGGFRTVGREMAFVGWARAIVRRRPNSGPSGLEYSAAVFSVVR